MRTATINQSHSIGDVIDIPIIDDFKSTIKTSVYQLDIEVTNHLDIVKFLDLKNNKAIKLTMFFYNPDGGRRTKVVELDNSYDTMKYYFKLPEWDSLDYFNENGKTIIGKKDMELINNKIRKHK